MGNDSSQERRSPSSTETKAVGAPAPPVVPHRRTSLRDQVLYFGFALTFAALGIGAAWIAPVLHYDFTRNASGEVDGTIHRRLFGLVPIPDVKLTHIVSAEVKSESEVQRQQSWKGVYSYDVLILTCADDTRWESYNSSDPMGGTNPDVASGVQQLLEADSPQEFSAWQGEKVPLVVGGIFLLPAAFLTLLWVLKLVLFRG